MMTKRGLFISALICVALGAGSLARANPPTAPSHPLTWQCVESAVREAISVARAGPVMQIEESDRGTFIDGFPARRLVGSPENGIMRGARNDGFYFYTDSEGVHHTVKVVKSDDMEVRGAFLHQAIRGPLIVRIGLTRLPNGETRLFIDRTEMFHGEEVSTLQGVENQVSKGRNVDLAQFYRSPPETRLSRQFAHLIIDAADHGVKVTEPDFIFTRTSAQLLDPGLWTPLADPYPENLRALNKLLDISAADPLAGAAFLEDFQEELSHSKAKDLSPAWVEENMRPYKAKFLTSLFRRNLGVLSRTLPNGVELSREVMLGRNHQFKAEFGDRIAWVDGKPIGDLTPRAMLRLFDGSVHTLTIFRGGEEYVVPVDLGPR